VDSREALLALNLIKDVGPITVRHLMDHFGNAPAILRASVRELLRVNRVGPETAQAIVRWEQTIDLAGELKRIRDFDCRIITNEDDEYPPLLREIYDPPIILYARGQLTERDHHAVAIVGTRMATQYGRAMANKLAGQLAHAGLTIISGGARGIDSASHEGVLSPCLVLGWTLYIPRRMLTYLNASRETVQSSHSSLLDVEATSSRFLFAIASWREWHE